MSADRTGFALALAAVAFAAAAGAVEPWTAAGPPIVDELPTTWRTKASAGARAEPLADGRVALRVDACGDLACRAVVERPVALAGAPAWLVTAEVVRHRPGERAKVFLSATDLDEFRWFGGQRFPERGPGIGRAVVREDLARFDVNVGVIAVGPDAHVEVGRITVAPARRSVAYGALFAGLVAATVAAAAHAGLALWRALDRAGAIALAALGLLLLLGVTMPQAWLDALLVGLDPVGRFVAQKLLGHGGAFLLLGLLAARTGARPARVLPRLLAVAVVSEALQLANPGRTASAADVAIDLAGALLGVAIGSFSGRGAPPAPRASAASPP